MHSISNAVLVIILVVVLVLSNAAASHSQKSVDDEAASETTNGTIADGIITTVAGIGIPTFYNGEHIAATDAQLGFPNGITVDSSGTLYFIDSYTQRIRKIENSTGIITTIVGTGERGYSGDDGPAINAQINALFGITLDDSGNLFIADTNNHRIRKVDATTGIISTVTGTGERGYGGDNGPALDAQINAPHGIAVDDSNNLFFADAGNSRIRKVDVTTGIISTVAGTGIADYSGDGHSAINAHLHGPSDVVVDNSNHLLIADRHNHRIRKVDAHTGTISTMAGIGPVGLLGDNGSATSALLQYPSDIVLDKSGNLFIADPGNKRIRKVDVATSIISTVAGNGESGYSDDGEMATNVKLSISSNMAVDRDGNLYLTDTYNHRIRKVDATTGIITTVAGIMAIGDGASATTAQLISPSGIAVDGSDNLFIADTYNHRIRRVDTTTGIITTVAGIGCCGYGGDLGFATNAELLRPERIAVDGRVTDAGNNRIRKVDASTGMIATVAGTGKSGYSGDNGPAIDAQISGHFSVALDASGNLYIADTNNHRIRRIDVTTGIITTVAGTGEAGFSGDHGLATNARLNGPADVTVDKRKNLYIADTGNKRIRKVDASTGMITTVAGTGSSNHGGDDGSAMSAGLSYPKGLAVDRNGNLFIAVDSRIHKVDACTGIITTIAGHDSSGYGGDDGPATSALLNSPIDVALDSKGNLYIVDTYNHRVRKIVGVRASADHKGCPTFLPLLMR
ncbi:SMP-30/gluconolactonase/LRE family protein [Chloroflexi bacterium TSY]|nr:SMP-30/gluconolactonase/LRE family protein [Chloroflexi bacterium TSY]